MNVDAPTLPEGLASLASVLLTLKAGACRGLPPEWFFPEKEEGRDNHGDAAKAACALCPVREACLMGAVARNEPAGIWGGAGEARRRRIRAVRADPSLLASVLSAHWRQLDGCPVPGDQGLLAVYGDGATHGRRSTQAKGCRCAACDMAASFDGAVKAVGRRKKTRKSTPLGVAA